MENKKIWQSYVWHGEKSFFVSTISRDFDTHEGVMRGEETLTWEYDWEKHKRGKLIGQSGGILDHQATCRSIIEFGKILEEDGEKYLLFH